MDLGLTLDDRAMAAAEEAAGASADAAAAPAAAAPGEETPTFDFQGFGGGLVEQDEGAEEVPSASAPSASGPGLDLEDALASSYDLSDRQQGGVSSERIQTDAPLSEQGGQAADWVPRLETENEAAPAAASPPFSTSRRSGGGGRAPRARPAPPPPAESSGIPLGLVAAVVLLLVGGGGFLGWRALQGRGEQAAVEEQVDPPVTIPAIPAELEPRVREVAQLALQDWIVAVRDSLPVQRGLAPEPDPAWLGSEYMADASRFASVAGYWRGLDGYVDGILADEQAIYESFLDARLVDSLGAPDPNARILKDRAAAGFQAARPDRRVVYRQLLTVIDAAAGLHEFLVENEDRIEYQPGPERDPVLEAVPETSELGDDMWGRVDGITTALDGLGALDKVTTQRLMGLAVDKFEVIGIR
jgi:hypothetical protein